MFHSDGRLALCDAAGAENLSICKLGIAYAQKGIRFGLTPTVRVNRLSGVVLNFGRGSACFAQGKSGTSLDKVSTEKVVEGFATISRI